MSKPISSVGNRSGYMGGPTWVNPSTYSHLTGTLQYSTVASCVHYIKVGLEGHFYMAGVMVLSGKYRNQS